MWNKSLLGLGFIFFILMDRWIFLDGYLFIILVEVGILKLFFVCEVREVRFFIIKRVINMELVRRVLCVGGLRLIYGFFFS